MRKRQERWLEYVVLTTCIAMWAFFIWWALGGVVPAGGL
jgi:hypothetical protein